MQNVSPEASRRHNPLTVPLVIASVVAVAEAIALAFLLGRCRPAEQPVARGKGEAVVAASVPASRASPAPAAEVARGKVGQRVDSRGFGITVEKILHEPATYKDMVRVGDGERYIALLVAADNNTGENAQLYPSQFALADASGFNYNPLGVKGTMPALEWTTLGNRQTVRGHVDFVVPKSAKSLQLVYSGVPHDGSPIHVDLGE